MNAIVALLAALLALISCAPARKACERNYGPCGAIMRDTLIQSHLRIDSATVYMTVPAHDTSYVYRSDTVVVQDEAGRVELRRWYDHALNQYRIACEAKARDTVVLTTVRVMDKPPPTEEQGGLPWWVVLVLGIIGGLIIRIAFK